MNWISAECRRICLCLNLLTVSASLHFSLTVNLNKPELLLLIETLIQSYFLSLCGRVGFQITLTHFMFFKMSHKAQWASCQMHISVGFACAAKAGNVFPATAGQRSRHISRHVTHVPWWIPGSLTSGFLWSWRREKRSAIPGTCATRILRTW